MIKLFTVNMDADAAIEALDPVLRSGYVAEGPKARAFEAALRQYLQWPYAVLCSSGTAALTLAARVANLKPGDVVATTPLTCLITNEVLTLLGCQLVWIDVNPKTGQLDIDDLRAVATLRSLSAIMCCHWGGSTLGISELRREAYTLGIPLIEDAAHSIGGEDIEGGAVGTHGDYTCFSFQAIKTLTTGDGGMLLCRNAADAERARLLRWFGLDRQKSESMRCYQQIPEEGYKFQMNDIAATIGLANLLHLNEWVDRQRDNAATYDAAFEGLSVLDRNPGSSCWLYSIRVKNAKEFIANMASVGIECSQVHARNDTQRIWSKYRRHLPGMDHLEQRLVCLPVGPHIGPEERDAVIRATLECA